MCVLANTVGSSLGWGGSVEEKRRGEERVEGRGFAVVEFLYFVPSIKQLAHGPCGPSNVREPARARVGKVSQVLPACLREVPGDILFPQPGGKCRLRYPLH